MQDTVDLITVYDVSWTEACSCNRGRSQKSTAVGLKWHGDEIVIAISPMVNELEFRARDDFRSYSCRFYVMNARCDIRSSDHRS